MSIALQPAPITTPVVDKQGKLSPLWSRYFVAATRTITTDAAPADARYLVATANPSLTQETNLGALPAGHLRITVAAGVAAVLSSATIPSADLTGALPAISGAALTALPDPLPAVSGAALTALNASQLSSGTVPDARFPATLPAASGVNLTALKGSNVTHAVVTITAGMSPYAVLSTDETLLVDATAGAVTVTLPTPTSGRMLVVKKLDNSANAVTLTGTVDGTVNPTLTVRYNAFWLQGDGSVFWLLGKV